MSKPKRPDTDDRIVKPNNPAIVADEVAEFTKADFERIASHGVGATPMPATPKPATGGVVATWDNAAGTGTITKDGGGTINFTRATIQPSNPVQARRWPSMAAAFLQVGQRVRYSVTGSDATLVIIEPYAKHL